MAQISNTPNQITILRGEARKSFSLGVWITDSNGRPVNLTGCALRIVAKAAPIDTTSDLSNLFAASTNAIIPTPSAGYARFDIQASAMDQTPGDYDFAIVLVTAEGYSATIVKGTFEIVQNPEYSSVSSIYPSANPPQSLTVVMQSTNVINVYVGTMLPPGMNYVPDDVMDAIVDFDPDAIALVPVGGVIGYVLTKTSGADYAMGWLPLGQGAFGLDATGQPAGHVPAAAGDGSWDWAAVGIDATGITAGYAPVADGSNGWAWAAVTTPPSDWDATVGQDGFILNKPTLGTAAAADAAAFMDAATLVSAMPGIHFQTTVPVTGTDLHLYFVYTA